LDVATRREKESLRKVLKFFLESNEIGGLNNTGKLKVIFLAAHNARWPLWQLDDWIITDLPDRLGQKLEWRQCDLP
jgi:hypothetical protein